MTTSPAVPVRAPVLGRVAAGLALAVAAVHLLLVSSSGGSAEALALTAMALACLPCAWHLWRSPSARVWAVTAGVDAAMAVLHLRMVLGASGTGGQDMAGMHMHADSAAGGTGALVWPALGLVLAQLAVAAVAALHRPVLSPKPGLHAAAPAVTQM